MNICHRFDRWKSYRAKLKDFLHSIRATILEWVITIHIFSNHVDSSKLTADPPSFLQDFISTKRPSLSLSCSPTCNILKKYIRKLCS